MFITSRIMNRAVDESLITALYIKKDKGKFVVVAQIDTEKAHLPNSFYTLPLQAAETEAEAQELMRVYVESINTRNK